MTFLADGKQHDEEEITLMPEGELAEKVRFRLRIRILFTTTWPFSLFMGSCNDLLRPCR